jgi:hypothetical protein
MNNRSAVEERFFIPKPIPTARTKKDKNGNTFPVYLDARGKPMMWSGDFPIPEIGSRVYIKLNGIGWAIVKGYFESCGYVGLMTLASNPPNWLRNQQEREKLEGRIPDWRKAGIGCEFGAELSLARPRSAATR